MKHNLIRAGINGVLAALIVVIFASVSFAQSTDGTVATPPPVETVSGWKWVYMHFNAPVDATQANAVIRVSYMSASGTVIESDDIRITNGDPALTTDNELNSLMAAMVTTATGEPSTASAKMRFRVKKWLVDNGKLKYGAN